MADDAGTGRGELVAVKGRFRGDGSGLTGLFFAVADPAAHRIERFTSVVANEGNLLRTDIHQSWRSFEETLYTARFSGGVAQNLSREVQTYMLTHLGGSEADDLYEALLAGRNAPAQEVLSTLFGRVLGDGNVLVDLAVEKVRPEEVAPAAPPRREGGAEAEAPEAPAAAPVAAPAAEVAHAAPQEIVIKVEPLLSPLRGVAVSNLKPGHEILVRPVETGEMGRHIIRLTAQGLGVPENQIPVVVLSVEPAEFGRMRLRTQFGPGIVGISMISPELKVLLADAVRPGAVEDALAERESPLTYAFTALVFLIVLYGAWRVFFGEGF